MMGRQMFGLLSVSGASMSGTRKGVGMSKDDLVTIALQQSVELEQLKAQVNWLVCQLQIFCYSISCSSCPHIHGNCHNHNWYNASKKAVSKGKGKDK